MSSVTEMMLCTAPHAPHHRDWHYLKQRARYIKYNTNLPLLICRSPIPVAARSKGVGLRPLASWDCGFESRRGHWMSFSCGCLCCQVEVSATGWSLVQRSPTKCGVSECDLAASTMKTPRPTRAVQMWHIYIWYLFDIHVTVHCSMTQ
jgi:hypothetical protein